MLPPDIAIINPALAAEGERLAAQIIANACPVCGWPRVDGCCTPACDAAVRVAEIAALIRQMDADDAQFETCARCCDVWPIGADADGCRDPLCSMQERNR
jgi:hypothetical protein